MKTNFNLLVTVLIILLLYIPAVYGQNGKAKGKSTNIDSTAIKLENRSKALLFQAAASSASSTSDGGMQLMATTGTLPATYNYYVSTTGSDSNAGTQAAPLRTIQAAINKSVAGQAIKVADGRYVGCINFNGKSIKLVGNPNSPESVIIDGNRQGKVVVMDRPLSASALLCGFTITGGQTQTNVYPDNQGAAIYMYDNASPLLSDLVITGNTSHGAVVMAMHGASPTIQNSLIYSNTPASGGYLLRFNNGSFTRIKNITIAGNGDVYSIGLTYSSSVEVYNSIIFGSVTSQYEVIASNSAAYMGSISYASFYYNNIRGGTSLFYNYQNQGVFTASNTINVSPGYVDASAGKYQLAAGSPCIDAGDPATAWNDVNLPPSRGTARNDLGMYGWQVSAQPYQVAAGVPGTPGMPPVTVSPSNNRNYIHTIIPQVEVTSISTTAARSPSQYMETIEYFDGLGRPMQTVSVGASPDGRDIVTPIEYDAFGREAVKYLPYESTTNNGSYKADALGASTVADSQRKWYSTAHTGIPIDTRPFSETIFEPSPLNRLTDQYGPGAAWYTANPKKGGQIKYGTNIADDVRLWKATGTLVTSANSSNYTAGTLYLTETIDEDGRSVIEYTDLQGRVVRRLQKGDEGKFAITDFAYDDFGRLAYVMTPAIAANAINYIPVSADPTAYFVKYVYAYRYDARGRVVEKHIPSAGWTWIVYNKLDQPILTQDAVQRSTGQWSYTKYDAHGRVVVTGLYSGAVNTTRATVQGLADGAGYHQWESRPPGGEYTNNAFPNSATVAHTVNYYDNYDFPGKDAYADGDSRVHGLPTGSKVRVLDASPEKWLVTTMYYDQKGRIKHVVSDNIANGKDRVTNSYDFTGKLLASERNHNNSITYAVKNEYDHAARLKTVKYNTGGDDVTVAQNDYNSLGALTQTALHGGFETIGYDYNIRGWVTTIGSNNFTERLYYNSNAIGSDPQWAGNISALEWQAPKVNTDWNAYAFTYNMLSQLTRGYYKRKGGTDASYSTNSTVSKYNHYSEHVNYRYDMVGSIGQMIRMSGGAYMDNLQYEYYGFQATRTVDSGTDAGFYDRLKGSGTYYDYDAAGRMYRDNNKQLTYTYNHLGLVKEVAKDGVGSKLAYTYDATGRRLKKQYGTNASAAKYYMDGIETSGDTALIHTPYGRLRRVGVNTPWTYDYFLKDHLGNVRVVLTAGQAATTTMYMATMEEGASANPSLGGETAAYENQYFANLDQTRADRPYNYPDHNPLNRKVAKVPGKSRGPSIMLQVMAGDTITISAKAFYNMDNTLPGKGVDIAPVVGSAVAAMTNPTGTVLGEAAQLAADLGAEASQSVALVNVPKDDNDDQQHPQPKSGINFVAYNNNFDIVEANTGVQLVDDNINTIQTLATDKMVMQEAGFIEIFANNDAQTPVYFDNMVVTATTSAVTEVNAYYPFGGIITQLSSQATDKKEWNWYKYSAKELETALNLNWYDFGWRPYPPDFGRWITPDPLAEKYYNISPYAYALNNPINFIDPNGLTIDSLSQKQWDKEKSRITSRVERLENRNKNGRNDGRIASLNNTLNVMQTAEQSKQVYTLSKTSGTMGGVTLNTNTKAINISYTGTANFVHELTHVEQFESKWGHIGFDASTGNVVGQDIYDEVQAYRAQYAYDPSSVTGLPSTSTISSMQDILPAWVQGLNGGSLYVPIGHPNYVQGVSANTAIMPIYLNSTREDFIRGYPNYPAFRNLPANFILRTSSPNIYYKR